MRPRIPKKKGLLIAAPIAALMLFGVAQATALPAHFSEAGDNHPVGARQRAATAPSSTGTKDSVRTSPTPAVPQAQKKTQEQAQEQRIGGVHCEVGALTDTVDRTTTITGSGWLACKHAIFQMQLHVTLYRGQKAVRA